MTVETAVSAKAKKPDTRERILRTAEELIAQHGIEGFQLKDVADRVGIRPPSVFAHFKGRDAIAQAVSIRLVEGISDLMTIDGRETPSATLRRWCRELVTHLNDNPAHLRLILRDMAQASSPQVMSYESAKLLIEQMRARLHQLLTDGVRIGEFRRVRTDSVIALLLGAAISNLVWEGFDKTGRPKPGIPVPEVQREVEELAMGYVRSVG